MATRIFGETARRQKPGAADPSLPRRYTGAFEVPTKCEKTLEGHRDEVYAVLPFGEDQLISGSTDHTTTPVSLLALCFDVA